jgi:hypothetical protein
VEDKGQFQVLTAFEWEENTADPALLRAMIEFWYASSRATTDGDESDTKHTKQRMSQKDVFSS